MIISNHDSHHLSGKFCICVFHKTGDIIDMLDRLNSEIQVMKKAGMALVLAFLTIWIGLSASPRPVHAGGPTGPPTPPTIAVSAESMDCESIQFHVEIHARGNTLSYFQIKYRIGDNPTEFTRLVKLIKNPDQVTYPVDHTIIISELPPDTVIYYWAVLTYPAGSISTNEASARTAPVPSMSVSVQSVYSEGLFLIVQIAPYDQTINDWRIEYYTASNAGWSIARGVKAATNIYHVSISGLSPLTPVYFRGALDYQTHISERNILTAESSVTTNALPMIDAVEQAVSFDQTDILVEIEPNNNPIYASWLEYQVPAISNEWKVISGMGNVDESFIAHITGLAPGQILNFRSAFSYSTGGEIIAKSIMTETSFIKTNSISTGDYQIVYNAIDKTVDYQFNGTFDYTKRNSADLTHLDLGFIWSEKAEPLIDHDSYQLSLGVSSLPVHMTSEPYTFQAKAIGLKTGKTYYYRAYVIDKNGQIYYGDGKSCFLPTLTRPPEPSITKAATTPSEASALETTADGTKASGSDNQPTPGLTSVTTSAGLESAQPTPAPGRETTAASSTQPGNHSSTGPAPEDTQQQSTDHLWIWIVIFSMGLGAGIAGSLLIYKAKLHKKS